MWGLVYREKLFQYGARQKTIAIEGTNFYIYTDLEKAIDAKDRLSNRNHLTMVVVPMEEVQFIPYQKEF